MEVPVTKRRGRPRKADTEYTNNPNANNVRAYRARKRAENEAKLLEDQRVYKNYYNKNWKHIQEEKPDYSKDPTYEELAEARYNKHLETPTDEPNSEETPTDEPNTEETQQLNNDVQPDKNEDNTEPKVSVKITLPDVDETLKEAEKVVKGKHYEKNLRKRMKKKQQAKGNKTPDNNKIVEED